MTRTAEIERKTAETKIKIALRLDGSGRANIDTGIGFLDHMLTLLARYAFIDLKVSAQGDLEVDWHHTVEDVGLVFGDALSRALGDRRGICRYGHGVTPMDESLAMVTVDLSNRPYLAYHVPDTIIPQGPFELMLAKEFFRAMANRAGMNLHINVPYGENQHHIIEAIYKGLGRALDQATQFDARIQGVHSTKGQL